MAGLTGCCPSRFANMLLERGDKHIRDCYTQEKLAIKRLSTSQLPMNECHINLTIAQEGPRLDRSDYYHHKGSQSHAYMLEKLNIKGPNKELDVALANLFEPRFVNYIPVEPRRILIRGHPGFGKSVLCKKIVHDFIHGQLWESHFTRLLWIPLRNLLRYRDVMSVRDLLHREFFQTYDGAEAILDELECEFTHGGSLFLLEGLDEIRKHLESDDPPYGLVWELINQPNVIVTSRRSLTLPGDWKPFDLELETVGFYPEQVKQYIRHVTSMDANTDPVKGEQKCQEILDFLDKHPLIGDLVRVPIQLDALCLVWDQISCKEGIQTMSSLYQIIEAELWRRDAFRRGVLSSIDPSSPDQVERLLQDEIVLHEELAFAGLFNGLAVFDTETLATLRMRETGKTIDDTLQISPFLRSSGDTFQSNASRTYYFSHYTLQEYFAARHLRRKWVDGENIELHSLSSTEKESLHSIAFLHRYKYSDKCEFVWRFMTGLLASDPNPDHLTHYFQALQQQPLDLLGPAHQRLLMRCLFEIHVSDSPIRRQIEEQLAKWTVFGYKFINRFRPDGPALTRVLSSSGESMLRALGIDSDIGYKGFLARELEFPLGAVLQVLQELDEKLSSHVLSSMNPRPVVSAKVRGLVVSLLQSRPSREMVLNILSHLLTEETLLGGRRQYYRVEAPPSAPGPLLPAIVARLEDDDVDVRKAALRVLYYQVTLTEEMFEAVAARLDDEGKVRETAMSVLGTHKTLPENILQRVVERLDDGEESMRKSTLDVLEYQSELPLEILHMLAARLEDDAADIRMGVLGVLKGQAILPEEILQAVAARLDDEVDVREISITVLEKYPTLSQTVIEKVAARLDDEEAYVRKLATKVLGRQASLSEEILHQIAAKVEDLDPVIQEFAKRVLRRQSTLPEAIGARLEDAVLRPKLNKPLSKAVAKRPEDKVKEEDSHSHPPEETLEAFVSTLNNPDPNIRETVLKNLKIQSETLPEAILTTIVNKLDDASIPVRISAAQLLCEQPDLSESLLLAIAARLKHTCPWTRDCALIALENRPKLPEPVLHAVAKRVGDEDGDIRRKTLEILLRQTRLPDPVIPVVCAVFEWSSTEIKRNCGVLIGLVKKFPALVVVASKSREHFEGLFHLLLRRSFIQDVVWWYDGGKMRLSIDGVYVEYECEDLGRLIREFEFDVPDYGQKGVVEEYGQ